MKVDRGKKQEPKVDEGKSKIRRRKILRKKLKLPIAIPVWILVSVNMNYKPFRNVDMEKGGMGKRARVTR
jgi:hypothetical protein